MVAVDLITVPGCIQCAQFKKFWDEAKREFPGVELREIDATTAEGMDAVRKHQIFASPGILIQGKLFSTGGVNKNAFLARLRELDGDKQQ